MNINAFVHFDGQCREAVAFYADVFDVKKAKLKLYGDLPENQEHPLSEKDKERVAFASLKIKGDAVRFSDYPPGKKAPKGSSASLFLVVKSARRVDKLYARLLEGGKAELEPQKTSWTKRYAALTDRFGVRWHIARESGKIGG